MKTHGKYKTAEYRIWSGMRDRCENPNSPGYARYGARGITVCDRWKRFENFIADMGLRPSRAHSMERKRNDLGYSPENCVWATSREQSRNRRSNINVTINGVTRCLKDWCNLLGVPYKRALQRIKYSGWSPDKALTEPKVTKQLRLAHRLNKRA